MDRIILENMEEMRKIDFTTIESMDDEEKYEVLMMIAENYDMHVEAFKRKGVDADSVGSVVENLFNKVKDSISASMRGYGNKLHNLAVSTKDKTISKLVKLDSTVKESTKVFSKVDKKAKPTFKPGVLQKGTYTKALYTFNKKMIDEVKKGNIAFVKNDKSLKDKELECFYRGRDEVFVIGYEDKKDHTKKVVHKRGTINLPEVDFDKVTLNDMNICRQNLMKYTDVKKIKAMFEDIDKERDKDIKAITVEIDNCKDKEVLDSLHSIHDSILERHLAKIAYVSNASIDCFIVMSLWKDK